MKKTETTIHYLIYQDYNRPIKYYYICKAYPSSTSSFLHHPPFPLPLPLFHHLLLLLVTAPRQDKSCTFSFVDQVVVL